MQTLRLRPLLAILLAVAMLVPTSTFAASHREAPITALDRTADITDWYAFVSFNRPDAVTMFQTWRDMRNKASTFCRDVCI